MKKYIDFDGVIFDSEKELLRYYNLLKQYKIKLNKLRYIQKINWKKVLANSKEINDAINIINSLNSDTAILTRVHSMDNEAVAKIELLRVLGLNKEIIIVPYQFKKTDIVPAKGNILVDDAVFNLDDWEASDGIPIFFDKTGTNTDNWDVENKKYVKTRSLKILRDYE